MGSSINPKSTNVELAALRACSSVPSKNSYSQMGVEVSAVVNCERTTAICARCIHNFRIKGFCTVIHTKDRAEAHTVTYFVDDAKAWKVSTGARDGEHSSWLHQPLTCVGARENWVVS